MGEGGDHWPEGKPFRRREPPPSHSGVTRRSLLATAALLITTSGVSARVVTKVLPWKPNEAYPVTPVVPGGYLFFTANEAAVVDAFVDRLIPTDELGPGAKDAGVTTFIDRQLTGPYGGHDWLYMQGPFSSNPLPTQGLQSPLTPRQQYRLGLAALESYCSTTFNRGFVQLSPAEQDKLMAGLEKGEVQLPSFSSKMLFNAIHSNTIEGYFADPIYGGNRDMAGWKLVGFPGVRYDYRDVLDNPNKPYTLPPVGMQGRPAWGSTLMVRRLPRKDVVIVGLGWTGSILAYELSHTGLDVVAIERGPWRDTATDFNIGTAADELRYAVRQDIFLRPKQETLTMRNNPSQTALPIRKWGSFLPGNGVGGAGVHWNGQTWRFLPDDFRIRSHYTERYGEAFLPEGNHIQDWPVSFEELEPYYDKFERVAGISGKAGNIKGQIQPGGNPFEGARERDYPTPPMKQGYQQELFAQAATKMGLHPFPRPSANLSAAYTNPYGCSMAPCTFCGFCEWFGCANYSKSSPQTCVLPALIREPTFEARTECEVTKVNLTVDGKMATGVTYVDANGEEWEQPADLVLVCAYALFNVRLLLLSGIGKPYDPAKDEGVVGRNYAYQTGSGSQAFFENVNFNPFAAAGSTGAALDDYNSDNFDHGSHGFVGGASITCAHTNGRPILFHPTPAGTPAWGSAWKKAVHDNYQRVANIGAQGSVMSYRNNYLDLDPTYKDALGRPLMRMTFDYQSNEQKMANWMADRCDEIAKAMGAKSTQINRLRVPWNVVPYQSTHNTGGAVMGSDPKTSVLNRYLQSWDVPNVFVMGASAFPQNAGYNPTGTVGALTYLGLDGIFNYLKSSGPLVQP